MKRREFLRSLAVSSALGVLYPRLSFGSDITSLSNKFLVYIFLGGGLDPVHAISPYSGSLSDYFRSIRPNSLVTPQNELLLPNGFSQLTEGGNNFGFHPAWAPLLQARSNYNLGISSIFGIGILGEIERSHAAAENRYHLAGEDPLFAEHGWIPKLLNQELIEDRKVFSVSRKNMAALFRGLSSEHSIIRASSLESYGFQSKFHHHFQCGARGTNCEYQGSQSFSAGADDETYLRESIFPRLFAASPELLDSSIPKAYDSILENIERIKPILQIPVNPSDFGSQASIEPIKLAMQDISRIIRYSSNSSSLSILATQYDGFDTHTRQDVALPKLITHLSEAIRGLYLSLPSNLRERVICVIDSEFGRTSVPNSSLGHDHGNGGFSMAIGTGIKDCFISDNSSVSSKERSQNFIDAQIGAPVLRRTILKHLGVSDGQIDSVFPDFGFAKNRVLLPIFS